MAPRLAATNGKAVSTAHAMKSPPSAIESSHLAARHVRQQAKC